jgi:predicted permease
MVFYIVWHILTPVLLIMAVGFVAIRQLSVDLRSLAHVAFYICLPCLVFTTLAHVPLQAQAIGQLCAVHVLMLVALASVGRLVAWVQGWDRAMRSAFLLTVLIQNTGAYGLPVSQLAFGDAGLAIAVFYNALTQITGNTLGVVVTSSGGTPVRHALGSLLKVPVLYATLLALVVWSCSLAIPPPLLQAVEWCGRASVPLLLLLYGMQLAQLETERTYGALALATSVRLVVSPLMALALAWGLDMQGLPRALSVVAWGVPTGGSAAVLALQYRCQPRFVTNVILSTTVLSVLTLPVLLSWLI